MYTSPNLYLMWKVIFINREPEPEPEPEIPRIGYGGEKNALPIMISIVTNNVYVHNS